MKETVIQGKPIVITRQLPFTPDEDDLLYIEGHHTIKVERWRIEYYQDIINNFLDLPKNYKAGYFQLIVEMLNNPVFWVYFSAQGRDTVEKELIDSFDFQDYSPIESLEPAIYVLDSKCEDGSYRFVQYMVGEFGLRKVLAFVLERMTKRDWEEGLEYEKSCETPNVQADLVSQLQSIVASLHEEGLTDDDIITLLKEGKKSQYYLHISPRYEISLSEEKDGERITVHLSPLDKAVYILYLKHPEGIMFSYLTDYREELMEIYKKLMDYRTVPDMMNSIIAVTDPTQNSINEKCARIRRSFKNILGSVNAEPYCIMGKKGEVKKITLDRKYIVWE